MDNADEKILLIPESEFDGYEIENLKMQDHLGFLLLTIISFLCVYLASRSI